MSRMVNLKSPWQFDTTQTSPKRQQFSIQESGEVMEDVVVYRYTSPWFMPSGVVSDMVCQVVSEWKITEQGIFVDSNGRDTIVDYFVDQMSESFKICIRTYLRPKDKMFYILKYL